MSSPATSLPGGGGSETTTQSPARSFAAGLGVLPFTVTHSALMILRGAEEVSAGTRGAAHGDR
jgi:hypothetical protein